MFTCTQQNRTHQSLDTPVLWMDKTPSLKIGRRPKTPYVRQIHFNRRRLCCFHVILAEVRVRVLCWIRGIWEHELENVNKGLDLGKSD